MLASTGPVGSAEALASAAVAIGAGLDAEALGGDADDPTLVADALRLHPAPGAHASASATTTMARDELRADTRRL